MSMVDAASKYELLHARMNAVEGSTALGDRDFKMVQEMAKKPGLGFEEAASTMATLRGMKITAGEAKTLIEGIAQANASAGGTAEQFGRVMYQIRQSIGYGKLMQEDLRPILEAVPTLGALIQEHFGSNQGEILNKTLKESGKSVREFWLEVATMGAGMPSTGDTIANNMDNIKDSWVRLKASLMDTGAVKAATGALGSLLDRIAISMEKSSEDKSLRIRAQQQLGYGDNLTYYKNTGVRNDQIVQMMADLKKYDEIAAKKAESEKAVSDADDRAKADAKKKSEEAKAEAAKAAESERKRMAAHMKESEKNVEFTGKNEVTLREGAFGADPSKAAADRDREKAEAKRQQREEKALHDRQALEHKAAVRSAELQVKTAKAEEKSLKDRVKAWHEYADAVQGLGSNQLKMIMDGDFTATKSARMAFDAIKSFAAEKVTKVLEGMAEEAIFGKATAAATAATMAAEMAVISASAAPAAAGVSLATAGGNSIPASAGMTETYGLASTLSAVMRARGGPSFGPTIVGERGRELSTPIVPTIITPSHKTTNNTNQTVHYHFYGYSERDIQRVQRRAQVNGAGSSR
jgi:tape measure domain-containing protein